MLTLTPCRPARAAARAVRGRMAPHLERAAISDGRTDALGPSRIIAKDAVAPALIPACLPDGQDIGYRHGFQ